MRPIYNFFFKLTLIIGIVLALSGCAKPMPKNIENICNMFQEYPGWYKEAKKVEKKWGLKPSILMAIIYQESHFRSDAAPPRKKLLWIIPWKRPTSAYGYSQAVKGTWRDYKRETGQDGASRNAFNDAADFIGWFTYKAHQKAGIPMDDAYDLYLAYHEGIGGYLRGSYRNQAWLIKVAQKVQRHADTYHIQLEQCGPSLQGKPWWDKF